MVSGKDVFERAVMIMDEQSDAGAAEWADTQEYQFRAVPILNVLIQELYPFSDNFTPENGSRPTASVLYSLDDGIDLDDVMAGTVLPYGLVAHLFIDDNPAVASFCQQRYEELKALFGRTLPTQWDAIEDVYGGIDGRFARW